MNIILHRKGIRAWFKIALKYVKTKEIFNELRKRLRSVGEEFTDELQGCVKY